MKLLLNSVIKIKPPNFFKNRENIIECPHKSHMNGSYIRQKCTPLLIRDRQIETLRHCYVTVQGQHLVSSAEKTATPRLSSTWNKSECKLLQPFCTTEIKLNIHLPYDSLTPLEVFTEEKWNTYPNKAWDLQTSTSFIYNNPKLATTKMFSTNWANQPDVSM